MSQLFRVDEAGRTLAVSSVRCKDEAAELQALLAANLDLLPGEQIRPDDPRRWLLIKREMPVADPSGGGDRWSIDLFLVDQDGIPTFVECKRFLDTRSRREVVGQMLDYAANGSHYWSKEEIRDYVVESARRHESDLDEAIRQLDPSSGDELDDLLDAIANNLREGQVRLVFFLEEAPIELKSIVEFLNRQMERSEVLIVEAKQYEVDNTRLVAPMLFGYTEEARRAKKAVTVTSGTRRKWDEESFFEDARQKLDPNHVEALHRLLAFVKTEGLPIKWGTGSQNGSYNVVVPWVSNKSILTARSDGELALNFGWLDTTAEAVQFRDSFAQQTGKLMGVEFPEDLTQRYPGFKPDQWMTHLDGLIGVIGAMLSRESGRGEVT